MRGSSQSTSPANATFRSPPGFAPAGALLLDLSGVALPLSLLLPPQPATTKAATAAKPAAARQAPAVIEPSYRCDPRRPLLRNGLGNPRALGRRLLEKLLLLALGGDRHDVPGEARAAHEADEHRG